MTTVTDTFDRRRLLNWGSQGLVATALTHLLQSESRADSPNPGFAPRARRAIQISLIGGMSHVDSFDHKPELDRHHGQSLKTDETPDIFFGRVGLLRRSDWAFKQRGESGLWISDMFPHIAEMADEMTLLRSLVSDSANHTPALFLLNSGFGANGFPSTGSWISYGLGNESQSLPTFVVLPDGRGGPNGGASNWSNGFLPAQHQGIVFRGGTQPVRDLFPPTKQPRGADAAVQRFLSTLNRQRTASSADGLVDARIRSYELAARMQASVPEVSDLTGEPRHIQDMYGLNDKLTADCGRRCLLGRRLLEKGVRFVQIYSGGPIAGSPRASWDAHESVRQNHGFEASRIDRPVAALLRDLRQRGMLDDTLVLFTTEFGRTPFAQSAANAVGPGRDHNRYGFSGWLAGGGVRRGASYGSTDDVGWKAAEHPMPWHDFHATLLHLLGVDHTELTYYHNGIQRRLTNVHGEVHTGVFA
ncbi:MAG TPA: DUF1501 domain-containing protein [Planctomycetaceae bacterium]|nr:DUF1501 domain-containing protein [Planctomycetaceae bacterium]HCD00904.1 DUF1501 domain-containing protein [Planctomycetaceae bacterium]